MDSFDGASPEATPFEEHDLGTLGVRQRSGAGSDTVILCAPSRVTRAVWLLGAAGCLLFLYSAALTLGWFTPPPDFSLVRWPTLPETFFWLLPLILCAFSLTLAVGGTRVTIHEEGLGLSGFWPDYREHLYPWSTVVFVRFWDEQTRSRETLYGVRFRFREANLTLFVGDKAVWEELKERFEGI